jgi:DNA-directed RNA polymerase I, II, and III subunit RPABC5
MQIKRTISPPRPIETDASIILCIENEYTKNESCNIKMIIPIQCVSCGNPWLASRYLRYLELVKKYRKEMGKPDEIEYLTASTVKSPEGKAMDDVKITRECCRRHLMSHVDLL